MSKRMIKGFVLTLGAVALLTGTAGATPSTHIWAPSTDVQAYGVFHLTHDVYIPAKKDSTDTWPGIITNEGLTVGVIPNDKIQAEVGFDFISGTPVNNENPLQLNAKIGAPEDALAKGVPSVAVGVYGLGTKKDATDSNIYYGKVGKALPIVGRFSVGYYQGNDKLLLDEKGEKANSGILLCWERTISEISENLWLAVDYQGGNSSAGAFSYGFSWKFAPNTSVIFGYVKPNNDKLAGLADSYTVQLDIDFDAFNKKK